MLYRTERAAEQLELKYAQSKRYADCAEAFIERLTTESSWSEELYQMICNDDQTSAAEWLAARLKGSRAQQQQPLRWDDC